MKKSYNRREFTRYATLAGAASIGFPGIPGMERSNGRSKNPEWKENLKISLNAFSFDKPNESLLNIPIIIVDQNRIVRYVATTFDFNFMKEILLRYGASSSR